MGIGSQIYTHISSDTLSIGASIRIGHIQVAVIERLAEARK